LKQSDIPFKYKIKSLGDSCECCKALEDKEFDLKDAVIGVNYPPFNNCTCDVCRCFASHNINENN
jgi:hypothetical protein